MGIDDFVDEQRPNGDLPGIIPTSGWEYTDNQREDPGSAGLWAAMGGGLIWKSPLANCIASPAPDTTNNNFQITTRHSKNIVGLPGCPLRIRNLLKFGN